MFKKDPVTKNLICYRLKFGCRCCWKFDTHIALLAHRPNCILESIREIHNRMVAWKGVEGECLSDSAPQAAEEDAAIPELEDPKDKDQLEDMEDMEESEEEEDEEEEEEEEDEDMEALDAECLSAPFQTVTIVVPPFVKRAQRSGFRAMVRAVLERISKQPTCIKKLPEKMLDIWIFFIVVSKKRQLIYGILWTFSYFRQVTYPRTQHAVKNNKLATKSTPNCLSIL